MVIETVLMKGFDVLRKETFENWLEKFKSRLAAMEEAMMSGGYVALDEVLRMRTLVMGRLLEFGPEAAVGYLNRVANLEMAF